MGPMMPPPPGMRGPMRIGGGPRGFLTDEEKQKLRAMSQAGMLSDEMVSQIREKAEETVDTMGSTLVKSMGIAYAVKQDTNAGIDMDALQTKYLWISGVKMIAMALLVALTTVLV